MRRGWNKAGQDQLEVPRSRLSLSHTLLTLAQPQGASLTHGIQGPSHHPQPGHCPAWLWALPGWGALKLCGPQNLHHGNFHVSAWNGQRILLGMHGFPWESCQPGHRELSSLLLLLLLLPLCQDIAPYPPHSNRTQHGLGKTHGVP